MLSSNLGMRDTKWGQLAIFLFGIWTIATSIVCFEKADFLNLTIGAVGLLILLDP